MNSESRPAQANAALVLESFEAFDAGDTERLLAVVAPNPVMHLAELPEPLHGRETWRQGFELMKHAFPDPEAHVDDVVAADDIVAVRVSLRGTAPLPGPALQVAELERRASSWRAARLSELST